MQDNEERNQEYRDDGKRRGGGTIAEHGSHVVESYDGKRRRRLTRCFW